MQLEPQAAMVRQLQALRQRHYGRYPRTRCWSKHLLASCS